MTGGGIVNIDPIAFTVFGLEVRWYGVLIGTAMLLGVFSCYFRAEKFGIDRERIIDICIIALPAAVIGARFWYVLFNWEYYNGSLEAILNIRGGGLAFHGGLIFAVAAAVIMCRRWKINVWRLVDLAAPVIALGQAIGRWGNFFNHEAHGSATNLPWAIEVGGEMVHPTFLYESLWCFALFVVLMILSRNIKFEGQIFLLYAILYSLERFFVEWLRTDSLMIFGLKTAQIVSILAIIVCSIIYYRRRKRSVTQM